MFSFTEFQGQSSQDKHGGIRLNTTYQTVKKPVWLVLLKLTALTGMVAMAAVVITPALAQWLPMWKATLATIGTLLIYIGIAFFFRPEANTDNMGWFGGFGNDPFQYSDNLNRFLFKLHMLLGPGRFAAETMLDACALIGLAKGPEVIEEEESTPAVLIDPASYSQTTQQVAPPAIDPLPLRADRFNMPQGQVPRPL
ncbi:MAG TPA: hypothetical protein VFB96_08600 [Pirellulaceae bacterium]|nr:hypothetical protein [Pirellulaceae bacterium]